MASTGPYPSQSNLGLYVPNNYIWDVNKLYEIEVTDPQFKELLVRLYENINRINLALNLKDSAVYPLTEFINGQTWFPDPTLNSASSNQPITRNVFRLVINFGTLPNNATKSVAHNLTITSGFSFTRIYGAASDTGGSNYIPIPYASATAANVIELYVDGTNVNIKTNSNRTNFTFCYVILEYIKS